MRRALLTAWALIALALAVVQPAHAASPVPILTAGPQLKLKNIASNVAAPGLQSGALSNGTDTTGNFRSAHFNDSGVDQPCVQIVYSGWYTDTVSEAVDPNAYTISAGLESPAATEIAVTWGGSSSTSVAAGADVVSDWVCPAAGIKAGAEFWVRGHPVVSGGGKWPLGANLFASAPLLEAGETGVGLADKSTSGSIAGAAKGLRPSAILGYTTRTSWGLIGDSIEAGAADGNPASHGGTGIFARALDQVAPYIQTGVSGTTIASSAAGGKMAHRLNLFAVAGVDAVHSDFGTNDMSGASVMTTIEANIQNVAQQLAAQGIRVYWSTVLPKITTTDNVATTAGQTAFNAKFAFDGPNGGRDTVNDWIRSDPAGMAGHIEAADYLEPNRYNGRWVVCGATTHAACSGELWTASGSPTTTLIPSNNNKANGYYNFGIIVWATGAKAGNSCNVTSSDGSGNFVVTSCTPAPSAGDTFNAYLLTSSMSTDGTHPRVTQTTTPFYGGVYTVVDGVRPQFQALTTK